MDLQDIQQSGYECDETPKKHLIRLSDLYPNPCGIEEYVEVSNEIMLYLEECRRTAYRDYSRDYRNLIPSSFDEITLGELHHVFEQGADECYFIKLQSQELYAAMNKIRPEFARRFYLYHAVGMTMKEIADGEGISLNAVSKSLKIAALQLRRLLCNSDEENPYT